MGIGEFLEQYGRAELDRVAEKAGASKAYLLRLAYQPTAMPSLKLSKRLVEASDGRLTFEGLANPRKCSRRRKHDRSAAPV